MRIWIASLMGLALLLTTPAAALAHAVLLNSTPEDGAVLDAAPNEVVLVFNEPVSPIRIQVLGPDGEAVAATDAARAENHDLRIALPDSLEDGTHLVSFRVRSLDGHPVGGTVAFSLGTETAAATPAPDEAAGIVWRALASLARIVQILALFIAAGGAFYLVAVARASPPRAYAGVLVRAAFAGIIATALAAGLYGGLVLEARPAELLTAGPWAAGLDGGRGLSALLAILGLALIAIAARLPGRHAAARTGLLLAGALAAIASFPVTGHAATAEPRWLTMGLIGVHVAAAAFWAGSLPPLLLRARAGHGAELVLLLGRFSRIALIAVAVLVAAGVIFAWLQLLAPSDLWGSVYGGLLLGKAALAAALLAIAAVNKLTLTPRLRMGDDRARRRLMRNIAVEIGLVAAIVALTVALAHSPPPRHADVHHEPHGEAREAPQDDRQAGVTRRMEANGYAAFLRIEPAQPGENSVLVWVTDAEGSLIEPIDVTLDMANEALGIEPIRGELRPVGAGYFELWGDSLSHPGTWQLRVDVLVTDFEKANFRTEMEIR